MNQYHLLTTCIWDALNVNCCWKTVAWSHDMEGHAQKCVERYCELANKKTEQLHKVSRPCLDDHHFKKEDLESVGELSKLCSQIVLKCLYLARLGRFDILWSLHNLVRSVTKWTRACDQTLGSHVWYRTFTTRVITGNMVMWVKQLDIGDLDCFKTPILQETLKTQNQHQDEFYVFSEVEDSFPSNGCARNKHQYLTVLQTLVSEWTGCLLWTSGTW